MALKPNHSFTIDRARWLNGRTMYGENSYLLRVSDRLMCCLGFMAESCGVNTGSMEDVETVSCIANDLDTRLPNELQFLVTTGGEPGYAWRDSHAAIELMKVNDDANLTPEEREERLISIFRSHGVEVRFVGSYL